MKKRRTYLLVDGYNVIHSWPQLAAKSQELAEARDELIAAMSEYGAYERYNVVIAFDAIFTADTEHEEARGRYLTVVYTGAGETADSYIERRAYELAQTGHEVYVVTNDGAEQAVILGAGAYRIPSRELLARVTKVKKKLRDRYLGKIVLPYSRAGIGERIDEETAAKLDQMRKEIGDG